MAIVGDNPTTASAVAAVGHGRTTSDVLLLGAAGSSGQLIAAELVARGLSVRLAGRRRGPLEDLARALAADGATVDVRSVDVGDVASLVEAIAGVGVVVSTIGPFARLAGPVIDACLAARSPYVDIANEWSAGRDLLDRDEQARGREVALVTGAGFGTVASETLVLRLVGQPRMVPARVRVAAAAQVSRHGDGVLRTIEESVSQGTVTYRNGEVVREPLSMSTDDVSAVGVSAPRQNYHALVGVLMSLRALLDAIDAGDCKASDGQRAHIAAGAEVVCQLAADVSPDGRRP